MVKGTRKVSTKEVERILKYISSLRNAIKYLGPDAEIESIHISPYAGWVLEKIIDYHAGDPPPIIKYLLYEYTVMGTYRYFIYEGVSVWWTNDGTEGSDE